MVLFFISFQVLNLTSKSYAGSLCINTICKFSNKLNYVILKSETYTMFNNVDCRNVASHSPTYSKLQSISPAYNSKHLVVMLTIVFSLTWAIFQDMELHIVVGEKTQKQELEEVFSCINLKQVCMKL